MPDSPIPETRRDAELAAIDAALAGGPVEPDERGLAELAVALRDERPALDDPAAGRLDDRFAAALGAAAGRSSAGARRRGLRPTGRGMIWWPALAAVACVLLAAVVVLDELRGVTQPGRVASSDGAGGGTEASDADEAGEAVAEQAAGSGSAAAPEPADALSPPVPGAGLTDPTDTRDRRLVERSAFLVLATKPGDLADVASRVVRATDDVGGYVASSTVGQSADAGGGASFALRVPARELPRTLATLSRLAQVRERNESNRDITADAGRAGRRIAELRAERRGLLRALERAESAGESARLRARLRVVARRAVGARAEIRRLRNRAAFATVAVELVADADAGGAVADGRWTPGDAVRTAIRVLEVAVGVALVAAALAIPVAVAAVAVIAIARLAARRRRTRVLDAG